MDKKVFTTYSQYYDLLYKDKNYLAETQYIDTLIKSSYKDAHHILELGCGTGLHAMHLAELGYTVHGIDRSETMLRMAIDRQSHFPHHISQKLSFLQGDVRNYECAIHFDVVISLFHVMSYMVQKEDLIQAIHTAKKHLKENGLFIFDCWHGPGVLHDKPTSRTKTFENDTMTVKRTSSPEMEEDKHCVNVSFEVTIQDKKTKEETKLHELHEMRYLFTDELKSLLELNGFVLLHAEEWMTKKTLSEKAWYATYVCKKIN